MLYVVIKKKQLKYHKTNIQKPKTRNEYFLMHAIICLNSLYIIHASVSKL